MKNAKKILSLLLVIALTAAITLSATLAYLTDEDDAVNVMVMGNIDIEQHEHDRNGVDFEQNQTLLPIVGDPLEDRYKDANDYPTPDNYIDKIVTVENTGDNTAYVRTFIAIPVYNDGNADIVHWIGYGNGANGAADDAAATWVPDQQKGVENDWTWTAHFTTEIEGQQYKVYTVTHSTPLAAGAVTAPNLTGVYLDSAVDYDHNSGSYIYNEQAVEGFDGTVEVLVATQAVQYDSGWGTAEKALNTAFYTPATDAHPWIHGVMGGAWDGTADNEALEENTDTTNKVVEIYNGEQLKAFADAVNNGNAYGGYTVKLMSNINLNGAEWTPIGACNGPTYFQGTFDGQGYTISNLKVDKSTDTYRNSSAGLFGWVDAAGATIKNVKIDNATVEGSHWVGAVAGYMTGTISDCTVSNSTIIGHNVNEDANGDKVGGIVGCLNEHSYINNNTVSDCTITGNRDIGGIAGSVAASTYEMNNNKVENTVINYTTAKDNYASAGAIVSGRTGYVPNDTNVASNVTIAMYATVSNADELAAAVAAGATDIHLLDGEYDVKNCKSKTLTISGSKNAVLKPYNEGEDGCDYGFDGSTVTFNGVTIDTTANTGNYKGYARLNATFNDCDFFGAYTSHNVQTFNNCHFDFNDGYFWIWGAQKVTFNGCEFGGNSKAILAHGWASSEITINNCKFNATEKGYASGGTVWTAAVEIDPAGTNTYTINFTGENTINENYAGWTRVKDGSTGHTITGLN